MQTSRKNALSLAAGGLLLFALSFHAFVENYTELTILTANATVRKKVCTDSDGGRTYNKKGKTTFQEGKTRYNLTEDWCVDTTSSILPDRECAGDTCTLWEMYCDEEGNRVLEKVNCPDGCELGACKKADGVYYEPDPVDDGNDYSRDGCYDTDGGKVTKERGTTWVRTGPKVSGVSVDYCHSVDDPVSLQSCNGPGCYVEEWFCTSKTRYNKTLIACPEGCNEGVCMGPGVNEYIDTPKGDTNISTNPRVRTRTERRSEKRQQIRDGSRNERGVRVFMRTTEDRKLRRLERANSRSSLRPRRRFQRQKSAAARQTQTDERTERRRSIRSERIQRRLDREAKRVRKTTYTQAVDSPITPEEAPRTPTKTLERFTTSDDFDRRTGVNMILNALYSYSIDNGLPPELESGRAYEICAPDAASCNGFFDFYSYVSDIIKAAPYDKKTTTSNGTGYFIQFDTESKSITIWAAHAEKETKVTR